MKSVSFDFGINDQIDEGKGLDRLLDPFLQKKVAGQAGFDYEVLRTRTDVVIEVLDSKYQNNDVERILQDYQFYTLFLSMSVRMNAPDSWTLNWARFEYEIDGTDPAVLSFAPNTEGIRALIERSGSRELSLSLAGEINTSIVPIDTQMKPKLEFNRERGWKVKYLDSIDEIKWFKIRTITDRIILQWDIYNRKLQSMQDNIGVTTGIYATALIAIHKIF